VRLEPGNTSAGGGANSVGTDERPGFDRIRSYIGRLCRYCSSRDDVEREARAYAAEVYADRPERLAEHLARDHERLVAHMWERWGGADPLIERNDDQAIVDLWRASGRADSWVWVDERAESMRCEGGVWRTRGAMVMAQDLLRFRDEVLWADANRSVGDRRERLTKLYMGMRQNARVDRVLALVRKHVVVSAELFDADPWLVPFPAAEGESAGVVYDARTRSTRALEPSDWITATMGVPWSQPVTTADEALVEGFLRDALPDEETIRFVLEGFGLTLLGRSLAIHALFFLYGRGRTGKSTLLSMALGAFGRLGRSASFATFAEHSRVRSGSEHSDDLASLAGARLVACSEIPDGARIGARMKALTGDEWVTARAVRGRTFDMRVDFTPWVAGNDRPAADCLDSGVERRLHVIPVNRPVPEDRVDPMLPARLREPGPARAFITLALQGLEALMERGYLTPSSVVQDTSRTYWLESNPIEGWLTDRVERTGDPRDTWRTDHAYRDWQEYVTECLGEAAHGEIKATSRQRFARIMESAGHPRDKVRAGGKRHWAFLGVKRKEGEEGGKSKHRRALSLVSVETSEV